MLMTSHRIHRFGIPFAGSYCVWNTHAEIYRQTSPADPDPIYDEIITADQEALNTEFSMRQDGSNTALI